MSHRLFVSDKTALSLLKWSEFFIGFMMLLPVVILLYQSKGITVGDFFMIQGIFRIVGFLFEIPSGYLSDTFSRKKILLLGGTVWFLAIAGLFWAYGFWQIAMCEMGLGLSSALFSGTKEAYAYDLLKRMNREKDFLKENGSITTFSQSALFIAALLGGALYPIIGDWIVAIEAAAAFLGVLCLLWLPELKEVMRRVAPEASPLKDVMGIVKMSVRHPEIKWFMLFPAMFGSFTMVLVWILQPTMERVGVAIGLFGIFFGINTFSRIILAKYADRLYKIFGYKSFLYLCIAAVAAGIAMVFGMLHSDDMILTYLFCTILAIIPATQMMSTLVFNTYIHHRIKSTERGTVLSVGQMYKTLIGAGLMMLMKPLLDGYGIEWTMMITLMLSATLFWPLYKILKIGDIDR